MKLEILSDVETKTTYRNIKAKFKNIIISEYHKDGALESQFFTTDNPKESHPSAYEPERMRFYYYSNTDFLQSEENCNFVSFYYLIPKPTVVADWSKFNDIDIENILCDYLGNDGCVYKISQPDPIPLWRNKDYIGGFDNGDYDLGEVSKILKGFDWTRNVKIEGIPYYNQDDEKTKFVSFDYKLPSKKHLKKELGNLDIFKDHYFGY